MDYIGLIGLFLAIVVLGVGAYRGIGALPLTVMAGLVVILFNRMNIWSSFMDGYMEGYVGFFKSYFFIFSSSALYAKIMEKTGAAVAIGYKFVDWFGKNNGVLVVFLATAALTYGGVSLFVVVFAVTPIIMVLFREGDIPLRLSMGPVLAGSATLTMTAMPGSPQLTNVIPTRFLGTTLTAAPVLGIIASIMLFVFCYFYLKWEEKRLKAAGEHFEYIKGTDASMYEIDPAKLPSAGKSFTPMVILIAFIITGRFWSDNSTMIVVLAMILGSVLATLLNLDRFESLEAFKKTVNEGLGNGIGAIAGPCAVVAFGSLVRTSPAFQDVVVWVTSLDMNVYLQGVFSTAVISGITGSSSGGLQITLQTFGEQFVNSGANMGILHRLISIAAGSLDTLPHSSGLFLFFAWLGLTHKDGYRFVFFTSVVIPAIVVAILLAGVVMLGL